MYIFPPFFPLVRCASVAVTWGANNAQVSGVCVCLSVCVDVCADFTNSFVLKIANQFTPVPDAENLCVLMSVCLCACSTNVYVKQVECLSVSVSVSVSV